MRVTWTAVPEATSYNVYTATSKTSVNAAEATLTGLTNGTPAFVKVTAVNANGESAHSSEACAVPTAAHTSGLTLYDPLCSSALDGSKWRLPTFTRTVVNGAMQLSAQASNMEPVSSRGLAYFTSAPINAGALRVTSIQASVKMRSNGTSRDGAADLAASLALNYQPPANRLGADIGGRLNFMQVRVGLVDNGNGLRVYRGVHYCSDDMCAAPTSSGIAFFDPAGFDSKGEAPAAYDTMYTLNLSFDENTGVFAWSAVGGAFGARVGGTIDPAAYLASNAAWAAIGPAPLASGGGFQSAALSSRLLDRSPAGGSNGSVTAEFDNVAVGFNNAPATLWDDFSGVTKLDAGKWNLSGQTSMAATGGHLEHHLQMTASSNSGIGYAQGIRLTDPASVNTVQADVTISSCANEAAGGSNRVSLEANLYNDGSVGSGAPNTNQPNSQVGDVRAYLMLDCVAQTARFQIIRWNSTNPLFGLLLTDPANSAIPVSASSVVGTRHTLRLKWDPSARLVTFYVNDEAPVVVDPTTTNRYVQFGAPYVKAANTPYKFIGGYVVMPASTSPSVAGKTASMDFRLNNVFIAQ